MSILRSLLLALATFTRIPMPPVDWKPENMRHALAALPLVGVIITALLWLWLLVSNVLGFHTLLFAVGLTLIPILVTGGIHLDGFCDTVDALSSWAPMERKREILKDSHVGAFAVIGVALYLLTYFGFCTELEQSTQKVLLLGSAAILSRATNSFACLFFPPAEGSDLLGLLQKAAGKQSALIGVLWFALAGAVACCIDWRSALGMVGAILLVVLYVRVMSKRQFGGMSGDIAGYLTQLAELGALIALVLVEKVVGLL